MVEFRTRRSLTIAEHDPIQGVFMNELARGAGGVRAPDQDAPPNRGADPPPPPPNADRARRRPLGGARSVSIADHRLAVDARVHLDHSIRISRSSASVNPACVKRQLANGLAGARSGAGFDALLRPQSPISGDAQTDHGGAGGRRPGRPAGQPGARRSMWLVGSNPAAPGAATWTSCPFSRANAVRCRAQQLASSSNASSSTRMRPSTMP